MTSCELKNIRKVRVKQSCNGNQVFVKTRSNEFRSEVIEIDGKTYKPQDFDTTTLEEIDIKRMTIGNKEIFLETA